MRYFRDCFSCCMTFVVLGLVLLAIAVYLGLPFLTSAIQRLSQGG